MPSPYNDARIHARQIFGRLASAELREIHRSLDQFIARIVQQIAAVRTGLLPGAQGLERLRRIVQREADLLASVLQRTIETGRRAAFRDIERVWQQAGREYARARGRTEAEIASLRPPPVTLLGVWETLNPAGTWRTLLRNHIAEAAREANSIIRTALMAQVGPDEVARRLRRYVIGSEPFQKIFSEVPTLTGDVFKLDLRTLPAAERGAAREMVYNAERIAFSELHNARAEAEVQHMVNDPYIKAVQWTLSPDRGSLTEPDECDYLAETDFYGMGPGVFPVDSVPSPPHPFDRCELRPITRATDEIQQPKPQPTLKVDPRDPGIKFPRSGMVSDRHIQRSKDAAWQAIRNAAVARPT